MVDASTVGLVKALGGLTAIAVSHPHYYASMVEWSRAFGGIPIYLHEADREWVQYPDSAIVFWKGETHRLNDDFTLIRVRGHFSGFQVLHWASGEKGSGALMTGDMPQVCPDRRYVSFMYSYPNLIPVDGATVRDIVSKLEPYKYSRLYGAWPKFVVSGDAKTALRRSAERYLRAIGASATRKLKPRGENLPAMICRRAARNSNWSPYFACFSCCISFTSRSLVALSARISSSSAG